MLGSAALVAFIPITSSERARAFYAGTLGLTVVEDTPFALVLRAGDVTLRATLVDALEPRPFTVLGWEVADVWETTRRLTEAGVEFRRYDGMEQDELGVWTAPDGTPVAWFSDPDGNTLSLNGPAA
jgi:catechol 2,3-dioxygenase-like lactoylglutathione lyase family enzyme